MIHHPIYLEDYIVCLCELSDIATPGVTAENMIRLSKFDRTPIRKLANQVKVRRLGFTHKQVDFVKLLLNKYCKQLTAKQISLTTIAQVPLFFPIRVVEQIKKLTLVDGMLHLEFNYNSADINLLRDFENQGRCRWAERYWEIYPSEHNFEFVMEFARRREFDISDEVCALHAQLTDFKAQHTAADFQIVLQADATIANAPDSLLEHLAEADITGIVRRCDNAYLYKYDISDAARYALLSYQSQLANTAYWPDIYSALLNRTIWVTAPDYLELARQYCRMSGRGPVILLLTRPSMPSPPLLDLMLPVSDNMLPGIVYYAEVGSVYKTWPAGNLGSNGLVITDTDQLDWLLLYCGTNKIWYIKKEISADKNID